MTVAEATTVLRNRGRSQGNLHILESDPAADRSVLEQLAVDCHQFSPLVGLETFEIKVRGSQIARTKAAGHSTEEPSSLLLDVTGSAPRLGGELVVAQRMVDFTRQLGYRARVGVAHTVGAAWAFAHTTNDIMIVPTDNVGADLSPLPIEALRLPRVIGDLLTQLGIRQIGELFQLPRESLQARFGPELLLRMDQATGRVAEAIVAHAPPPPLSVTRKLEHPITRREAIEQLTRDLVAQLCESLVEQDHEAIQVQYCLLLTSKTINDISVGLYQATANPQHIYDLLQMQLESTYLRHPVQQATLTATLVANRADAQHKLFDTESSPAPKQLAHLIERLSCRLGADSVVAPQLSREPQIELAYRYRALAGNRRRIPSDSQAPRNISYTRPLRLIHPPVPVHIPATMDFKRDGPPTSFHYHDQWHHTIAYWGPERIETGWWRGNTIRRDYYRIENDAGGRFWLFRDLRRRRWFLHGEFV